MSKTNSSFSQIKLVCRRTSPLVKTVVLVTVVLCTVALITLRVTINQEKQKQAKLEQEYLQQAQQNRTLTQNIAELGTVESVKRIAEAELGYVDPNTQFFTPNQ